jgi:hypothetical protein
MNFLYINLLLMATSWVALMVFSFGIVACLIPLAPFLKGKNPPKIVSFSTIFLAAIYQIYFWGLWSAYCVAVVMKYTQLDEVTTNWLYWVCGFMWCTALIGWLSGKEQQGQSFQEAQNTKKGSALYSLIAVVGFLTFAFVPHLAVIPYGWFMELTGLSEHIFHVITPKS